MTEPSEQGECGLIMPFVVVESKGGPYDDGAYVAGCELGDMMARMRFAKEFRFDFPDQVVHRENVPQIDLIAMRYGIVMTELDWGPEVDEATAAEWAWVSFRYVDPESDQAGS